MYKRQIKRREGKLGLIVIDYLQLIQPDSANDPRQEQVSKIARRLKGLARELKVPVLCLSQLNRQAEDSKDHRPKLSHLRESGAIEQDADVVMFVHREAYFQKGQPEEEVNQHQALIIIEKQRSGPTGDVELHWESEILLGSPTVRPNTTLSSTECSRHRQIRIRSRFGLKSKSVQWEAKKGSGAKSSCDFASWIHSFVQQI